MKLSNVSGHKFLGSRPPSLHHQASSSIVRIQIPTTLSLLLVLLLLTTGVQPTSPSFCKDTLVGSQLVGVFLMLFKSYMTIIKKNIKIKNSPSANHSAPRSSMSPCTFSYSLALQHCMQIFHGVCSWGDLAIVCTVWNTMYRESFYSIYLGIIFLSLFFLTEPTFLLLFPFYCPPTPLACLDLNKNLGKIQTLIVWQSICFSKTWSVFS